MVIADQAIFGASTKNYSMTKKILITAYAVNPYKGSEDGVGWNIIRSVSRQNEVIAITRENNEKAIKKYLSENPLPKASNLRFEYFDLPYWLRFWKKGNRGASLYHILWHFGVVFFILKKRLQFDIAHHLNFHSDWSPSFLYLLGKPMVWGPVGHHHKIPRSYILPHGKNAWLKDRMLWLVKSYFWKIDPFLHLTKIFSRKIIGVNSSVFKVNHIRKSKQVIIPAVADYPKKNHIPKTESEKFSLLSIGRFVPLKGFDITVRAFAKFYHRQSVELQSKLELILIGKGPQKGELIKTANQLSLPQDAVRFIDWIERSELDRYFSEASAFVFPSHEGAGMVIPEALSFGLPVIVFDNYGPGEFVDEKCAIKIPYSTYELGVQDFAKAMEILLTNETKRKHLSENALKRFQEKFTWDKKAQQIQAIYDEIFLEKQSSITGQISVLKT